MKALLINGSPRENGNTARALREIGDTLAAEGVESETAWIETKPVRGCIACGQCKARGLGRCVFDDDAANRIAEKLAGADGIVVGSPTYYGQPAGALLAVMQRVSFAAGGLLQGKPAACVAVCRRGGSTAAFQCLNMMFQMQNCPMATSQYWNVAFGLGEGEAERDAEGMQTMRTLARNLAWMMKNLRGEGAVPRAAPEAWTPTHFIR